MPCVEFSRMRGRIRKNAPESILSAFFAHFSARILRYSAVCGAQKEPPFRTALRHSELCCPPVSCRVDVHGAVLDIRIVAFELVVHSLGDDVRVP